MKTFFKNVYGTAIYNSKNWKDLTYLTAQWNSMPSFEMIHTNVTERSLEKVLVFIFLCAAMFLKITSIY